MTPAHLVLVVSLLVVGALAASSQRSVTPGADGVTIVVVSPGSGAAVVTGPLIVTVDVALGESAGADLVRANPARWRLCYSLDGDRPPVSSPLAPAHGWSGLPVLDDARLHVPGTAHAFEAWLQRDHCDDTAGDDVGGEPAVAVGYTRHGFTAVRKVSAHGARLDRWRRQVAALGARGQVPAFIEVGTSFFETLAHDHAAAAVTAAVTAAATASSGAGASGREASTALWVGTSVEPVSEYLAKLPTAPGLAKVNAMVCPDGGARTLYTFQGLEEAGMDTFFHGEEGRRRSCLGLRLAIVTPAGLRAHALPYACCAPAAASQA
jgi:hypothetical protein